MSPSPTDLRPPVDRRSIGRRDLLAVAGTASALPLTGCSVAFDYVYRDGLADTDVLVVNWTTEPLAGSVDVIDPNGDRVLEEQFELVPDDKRRPEDLDDDGDTGVVYGDVLTVRGEYTVSLELDADGDVDDVSTVEETVHLTDLDDEQVGVFLGAGEDGPIAITVFEEPSDVVEYDDTVDLPF